MKELKTLEETVKFLEKTVKKAKKLLHKAGCKNYKLYPATCCKEQMDPIDSILWSIATKASIVVSIIKSTDNKNDVKFPLSEMVGGIEALGYVMLEYADHYPYEADLASAITYGALRLEELINW